MELTGEKVFLTPITKADTKDIVRWRNCDKVRRNFIYQKLFTEESHNHWVDTMVHTGKVAQFVIHDRETGLGVGSVFLRDIDRIHNKAEYGIFIGEDAARGRGFGSEAAKLIVEYGFKVLGLHKIMLRVFADNGSAIRSYEKAGFVKEAYLKDEVRVNGEYRDFVLMALIQGEDQRRKA